MRLDDAYWAPNDVGLEMPSPPCQCHSVQSPPRKCPPGHYSPVNNVPPDSIPGQYSQCRFGKLLDLNQLLWVYLGAQAGRYAPR